LACLEDPKNDRVDPNWQFEFRKKKCGKNQGEQIVAASNLKKEMETAAW
jgi:hypothetical protein